METKKPFWKWVFCENDGTPSFARIATAVLMSAVISWDSCGMFLAWLWNSHHLAPGQAPLPFYPDPMVLAGQAGFFLSMYGTNRFSAMLQREVDKKD